MHYKFFIRLLKNNPYLASTVTIKNLIPPVCQRFYRTHASAVNKKASFHSSVMFCSLLGVGVLRKKKADTGTISNMSSPTEFDNVKVNDQLTTTRNLSALLFKQKFYMNMIDSLEPTGDLNPNEAKVQSEHLKHFYEEFISNQSEIATLVENSSFDHQVEISQKVEQKVCQIQTKLEEIISPIKTVQPSANSVINDHSNQTEHLHVTSNFLDSIAQKASTLHIKLKRILASVTSLVPEDVSYDDVDAELESLGSGSYVNQKLRTLISLENKVYEQILANIVYSPKAAGSDHLRPLVDDVYQQFLRFRKWDKKDARKFPYILKKIKESSERVDRAVKDYRLYCEGKIPKESFDYLSSKKNAVR